MKIIAIVGSPSGTSTNHQLLLAIQKLVADKHDVTVYSSLPTFDLFTPERLEKGYPEVIQNFKEELIASDAVIISTPEYTHGIPAVLKNMFEWVTASGELDGKAVLPITFMPQAPRGQNAMDALVNSLKGVKAKIIAELPLYISDVEMNAEEITIPDEVAELIQGAIDFM